LQRGKAEMEMWKKEQEVVHREKEETEMWKEGEAEVVLR